MTIQPCSAVGTRFLEPLNIPQALLRVESRVIKNPSNSIANRKTSRNQNPNSQDKSNVSGNSVSNNSRPNEQINESSMDWKQNKPNKRKPVVALTTLQRPLQFNGENG